MFSRLTVGPRLAFAFAAVLLALAALWALSTLNIRHASTLAQSTAERHEKTSALSRAQSAVWALRWDVAQFLAVTDAATRRQIVERAAPERKQFEDAMAAYGQARAGALTADEEAFSKELGTAFRKYADARVHWFGLIDAGSHEEAVRFRAEVLTPAGAQTVAALGKLIETQGRLVAAGEATFREELARSQATLDLLMLAATAIAGVLAWRIARSITKPLREAVAAVEAVAAGDLTRPVAARSGDEVGQLLAALAACRPTCASWWATSWRARERCRSPGR